MFVDGFYQYEKRGFVQIMVNGKYVPKHRYLYEQAYGEITKDEVIMFLNGDKRDFRLENLIKVTRSEQVLLNKIYGGFTSDANQNLINLNLIRLKMKRYQLARDNGLLRNNRIPEDEREYRHKHLSDPLIREAYNKHQREYKRKRYAEDEAYREKMKALSRENTKKCRNKQ